MEKIKIEHFESDHGIPFPGVESLSEEECQWALSLLMCRLGVSPDVPSLDVQCILDERQRITNSFADAVGFDLMEVLPRGVTPDQSVMINWYRFDEIDKVPLKTLCTYFDDFWYPASDDIDIFDADLLWVVSIRHDGLVKDIVFV